MQNPTPNLMADLAAFAAACGGTLRIGRQPARPPVAASLGRPAPVVTRTPRDPYIEYTDDYSVWKQGTGR